MKNCIIRPSFCQKFDFRVIGSIKHGDYMMIRMINVASKHSLEAYLYRMTGCPPELGNSILECHTRVVLSIRAVTNQVMGA